MKRLAFVLGAAMGVLADNCTSYGYVAFSDPNFNWLIKGSAADRKGNVTAVCASASNPARDNLNQRLNDLVVACVPAGVDISTSALGVMVGLLNSVLCEQKADDLEPLRYCILSLLPLFDLNYFLSLSTGGGTFTVPSLKPVGDSPDRQQAMCESSVCNAFIENLATAQLNKLPPSPAATTASDFIRGTVSRMRCGCTGKENPCEGSTVANALISTANGSPSFVENLACDSNGMPTECARTWITCENVPPPQCAKPCSKKDIATVKFIVKNLKYDCLQTLLTTNTLKTIRADVLANIPGLLDTDFSCDCNAATAPVVGTNCTCTVTCANLINLKDVDLVKGLANLTKHATAVVIPTPTLDKLVPASCKITTDDASFGSSIQLLSASTNSDEVTTPNHASTLMGLSVVTAFLLSLVL